jgi:hypothetical protein
MQTNYPIPQVEAEVVLYQMVKMQITQVAQAVQGS